MLLRASRYVSPFCLQIFKGPSIANAFHIHLHLDLPHFLYSYEQRTYISRTYYNETNGALAIDKYATSRCPNLQSLGESACYLTLASCAALLRYVEHVYQIFLMPSMLRIRLQPNEYSILLDLSTLEGLELVSHNRRGIAMAGDPCTVSVLGVIDKTVTRSGKRSIRRALLEPVAGIDHIERRQDAVQELANSEKLYFALRTVLKTFPDVERCLSGLMIREHARLRIQSRSRGVSASNETNMPNADDPSYIHSDGPLVAEGSADVRENMSEPDADDDVEPRGSFTSFGSALRRRPPSMELINYVLSIKEALHAVPPLLQALENSRSVLLKRNAEILRNGHLATLARNISEIIEEDILPHKDLQEMRLRAAMAIKEGRNGKTCIFTVLKPFISMNR